MSGNLTFRLVCCGWYGDLIGSVDMYAHQVMLILISSPMMCSLIIHLARKLALWSVLKTRERVSLIYVVLCSYFSLS